MKYTRRSLFFLAFAALFLFSFSAHARVPDDPLYKEQWYLQKINAEAAWETTIGSPATIVAVIDTGVDEDHEDLLENLWVNDDEIADNGIDDDRNGYIDDRHGWDFQLNEKSPNPKFLTREEALVRPLGTHHGTVIAGIIGALSNNTKGIAGVSWNVRVMPLRALSSSGQGGLRDVVAAIDYAVRNGASVINLSFNISIRSSLMEQALRRAYEKGVVVVASAGNDSDGGSGGDLDVHPLYPACFTNGTNDYVIGVGATGKDDAKALFSHFGSECVDLAAPGVDITSTSVRSPQFGLDSFYSSNWSGTSFASAIVSGAAALLRSFDPTLSPDAVRLFLEEGAADIRTKDAVYGARLGKGRLDIARSLALVRSPEDRARILSSLPAPKAQESLLAFGFSDGKKSTTISITDNEGKKLRAWTPFSTSYRGGVNLVAGDTESTGHDVLFVIGGKGGGPHVRVYSTSGELRGQFFAFASSYRGGTSVAVGDVNPDGEGEIVAVTNGDHPAEAAVFSRAGERQLGFFPFGDAFRGGMRVVSGDVDGDGTDDFIFAAEVDGRPMVRVTDVFGADKFSFYPYSESVGAISLALADVDGDGVAEIITGRESGAPEVRVWKGTTLVANFFAYAPTFRSGVVLAGGDLDGDGRDEIVAVPRANGGAHVRIFSGEGLLLKQFFAREKLWRGGMRVAVLRP